MKRPRTQANWPKKLAAIEVKGEAIAAICDALPQNASGPWVDSCVEQASSTAEAARQGEDSAARNGMLRLKTLLESGGRGDIWRNWSSMSGRK